LKEVEKMKKYTHAWLAFMAIKRLEDARLQLKEEDRPYAQKLIKWFKDHKDGVINGAWYPDELIKDMADNHVLKFIPAEKIPAVPPPTLGAIIPPAGLKALPGGYLMAAWSKKSPVYGKPFAVWDTKDNLPDRCESLAESVIDHLKVQKYEDKGSSVSPSGSQVALWLFMLSHYVADAHVPVHCDCRQFSNEKNIHGELEKVWDDEIRKYYCLDMPNERFFYDRAGYPAREENEKTAKAYESSFLKAAGDELAGRKFEVSFGPGNDNVWDFMNAICHHSYLLSYSFFPPEYGPDNVNLDNWKTLASFPELTIEKLSTVVLADAVDSVARVWFRIWRRYETWNKK
jgi:hypothetical protein